MSVGNKSIIGRSKIYGPDVNNRAGPNFSKKIIPLLEG